MRIEQHGKTPLMFAAEGGHYDVVRLLLAIESVNVNSSDEVKLLPGTTIPNLSATGCDCTFTFWSFSFHADSGSYCYYDCAC